MNAIAPAAVVMGILLPGRCLPAQANSSSKRDYPVKPVPFTSVHVNDVFWAPPIETNRSVTIPFAFQKDEETGRVDLFIRAAKALRGERLEKTLGPGKASIWPGHQIIEMGLAKLYRVSGDERYVNLAKFMLDERGPGIREGGGKTYTQSHAKVVAQTEAVGHAVRATY